MALSRGAQYYVLLLAPQLLADLKRIGLARIIHCSGFPEHEVSSLYFEFVSVCRVLPTQPDRIPSELWDYLRHCVQVISTLVHTAEQETLARARAQAVRKFLPLARDTVEQEYQQQCQQGTVEFRLASLVHHDQPSSSLEQCRELCQQALRLERQSRLDSCRQLDTGGLEVRQAAIVKHALNHVDQALAEEPDRFATVDLVIRLLDLLRSVLASHAGSVEHSDPEVARIVLGLGNLLFSEELGLARTEQDDGE